MSSSSSTGRTTYPQVRRRSAGAYRLVRTPLRPVDPPLLDARQRAVVDHAHGPLLVLAGPGTGKTTTLVEAVAARVAAGADPERILVLTFSRRAAVELRDRMALRLGGARAPQATTFHSYCYALVRAHQDADLFAEPLRLLSGPEQDVAVRDLLAGQLGLEREGLASVRWPDELRACLTTRGFADEVRAVLARSRELGLGPHALADFARRTGRPDWRAAAAFLAEYLDVLDLQGVLDYAELVHRAVLLAERAPYSGTSSHVSSSAPPHGPAPADAYDAVFVDEYQDTDPAQVRLLRALAGGGRTLIAFGDPDQSIYAFRGADVNGILDFPDTFRRAGGAPAPVEVLTTSRRSGEKLLEATRLLTRRMPMPRLPSEKVRAHRDLAPVRAGGRVEAYTYPTASTELENIADIIRRAHLEEGVPWHDIAVLTRAGTRALPALRRALTAAGVPVEVDGMDIPLRHEPAVTPLLTALRAVARAALSGAGEEEQEYEGEQDDERVVRGGGEGRDGGEARDGAFPEDDASSDGDASVDGDAISAGEVSSGGDLSPESGASFDGDVSVDGDAISVGEVSSGGDLFPESGASFDGDASADDGGAIPAGEVSSGGDLSPESDVPSEGGASPDGDPSPDGHPDAAPPDAAPASHTAPPSWLDPETALDLLTSPLGGMDSADIRRLGRALRDEERAAGTRVPAPSDVLLARVLA
ncbi:ATP-dependent helicase, partial [Streptomyces sp. NPDC005877]